MVRLLERFRYTLEEDLQSLFRKKESDNPMERLNQYIQEAEKQTELVEKLLERQKFVKEKLEKEREEAIHMLEKRKRQLSLAVEVGENDLATFARQEVEAYENRRANLDNHLEEAQKELMELEQKFESMKHKMKDMKVRHLQLIGKENVERANDLMDEILAKDSFEAKSPSTKPLSEKNDELADNSPLETRLNLLEHTAIVENEQKNENNPKEQ